MRIRPLFVAFALGTIGSVLPAAASSTFHPSHDEAGSITHVVPGVLTRADREALDRVEAQREDPLYLFTSEEGGWELRPHAYGVSEGRLRHADRLAHDTPRPDESVDNPIYRYLERG